MAAVQATKPRVRIHPTAIVAEKASIIGVHDVNIGANAVIHPYAKIFSHHGSVSIGEGCIISERSSVGLLEAVQKIEAAGNQRAQNSVLLHDNVIVKSGAVVEAISIGKWSVIDINARVGPGCTLGEHCKINACITLPANTELDDYCVVYGPENNYRVNETLKSNAQVRLLNAKGHKQQIEVLRRLIPSNLAKWA